MDKTISGIVANLKGEVTEYGEGAEKIFGYKRDEVIGKNVAIFHPERERETVLSRLIETAMEKGVFEEDLTLVRKNGEEFPAHLKVSTIKDSEDNVTALVGMTTDLS